MAPTFGAGELRQFDVFRNPSAPSRRFAPFVAMIQSHFIEQAVVVVAPLVVDKVTTGVDIDVDHDGNGFVLALSELGSVHRQALGRTVGSLTSQEDDIRRALDKLFSGF
ncbi:MAG: CcdB family protein [Caulobacter sp.]|nr:CcdB family protein [Caulobacter sp.]